MRTARANDVGQGARAGGHHDRRLVCHGAVGLSQKQKPTAAGGEIRDQRKTAVEIIGAIDDDMLEQIAQQ